MASSLLPAALSAAIDQFASRSKKKAARRLLEAMGPTRKKVMQMLFEVIKDAATQDPDMFQCVRRNIQTVIDSIAEDVEWQVEEHLRLKTSCAPTRTAAPSEALPESPRRRRGRCRRCCRRFRGSILHHAFPHDRTLWGTLKDPVWWIFAVLSLVTWCSIRIFAFGMLLLLLVCPGPVDEYQLTRFILVMKTSQFVAAGAATLFFAAVRYYFCILFRRSALMTCVNPALFLSTSAFWFGCLDYVGNLVLPQLAMVAFHRSVRLKPDIAGVSIEHTISTASDLAPCCFCNIAHSAPARLRMLVRYDIVCFLLTLAFMIVCTAVVMYEGFHDSSCEPLFSLGCLAREPTVVLNAYWCSIFYALSALPFLLACAPDFTPISFSLITRASRTGYDADGQPALFRLRAGEPLASPLTEISSASSSTESSSDEESESAEPGSYMGMAWLWPWSTPSAVPSPFRGATLPGRRQSEARPGEGFFSSYFNARYMC